MESCRKLHDYSFFVAKVNEYLDKGIPLGDAIDDAVSYCIDNDILADILTKCQSEVHDMLLTEYDEKLHAKTLYNEGYEDGMEQGKLKERDRNISKTINMLKSLNLSEEGIIRMISEEYDISRESIERIINH